jgi:hypothetical protein
MYTGVVYREGFEKLKVIAVCLKRDKAIFGKYGGCNGMGITSFTCSYLFLLV